MSNNEASATDVSSLADQLLSLDITSEAGRVTFMSSIEEKINDPVTMLAVLFYKAYMLNNRDLLYLCWWKLGRTDKINWFAFGPFPTCLGNGLRRA
jgi:hypothetical protein